MTDHSELITALETEDRAFRAGLKNIMTANTSDEIKQRRMETLVMDYRFKLDLLTQRLLTMRIA